MPTITPIPAPTPGAPTPARPTLRSLLGSPGGNGGTASRAPTPKPSTAKVTKRAPDITYQTHALIGRREEDNAFLVLGCWDHCPTKDEIKAAQTGSKFTYTQYGLMNATGFWDAVEKPKKPIW